MAETKFTPGPWKAQLDEFGQMVVECPQSNLITLLLPDDNKNYVDDAHLIAAAPDLYAALELLLSAQGQMEEKAIKMAKVALAKARGEANEQG